MSSSTEKVIHYYKDGIEDTRATHTRSNTLEFHYTKKMLAQYIMPDSAVIELGCATGYYGLFFAKSCAEYTGVDISPDHIAILKARIEKEGVPNLRATVGDATALTDFENEGFDVVLCLGPMYHLSREERQAVWRECLRIARPGGILAFAYINGIGTYAGACVHDEHRALYPNAKANQYVFQHQTDDVLPGLFFFTSPEAMEKEAKSHGLEILQNRGVDFFFAASAIDAMSQEQFSHYMVLADKMNESPSCVGLSNHALLVYKK